MARPHQLSLEQREELREAALAPLPQPPWRRSTRALVALARERYGASYTEVGMQKVLHGLKLFYWPNCSAWLPIPHPRDQTERARVARRA